MKQKVLGILTPVTTLIFGFGLTVLMARIVDMTSSDGWAGLGAFLVGIFLTGFAIIIELIVGVVLYVKKKTDYSLYMMIGVGGTIVLALLFVIIAPLFV